MAIKWFGESWGAPVNLDCDHVPTPTGEHCAHCDDPILEGDSGFVIPHLNYDPVPPTVDRWPWHRACFFLNIFGAESAHDIIRVVDQMTNARADRMFPTIESILKYDLEDAPASEPDKPKENDQA